MHQDCLVGLSVVCVCVCFFFSCDDVGCDEVVDVDDDMLAMGTGGKTLYIMSEHVCLSCSSVLLLSAVLVVDMGGCTVTMTVDPW